jgi:hypothetical protein
MALRAIRVTHLRAGGCAGATRSAADAELSAIVVCPAINRGMKWRILVGNLARTECGSVSKSAW